MTAEKNVNCIFKGITYLLDVSDTNSNSRHVIKYVIQMSIRIIKHSCGKL